MCGGRPLTRSCCAITTWHRATALALFVTEVTHMSHLTMPRQIRRAPPASGLWPPAFGSRGVVPGFSRARSLRSP